MVFTNIINLEVRSRLIFYILFSVQPTLPLSHVSGTLNTMHIPLQVPSEITKKGN